MSSRIDRHLQHTVRDELVRAGMRMRLPLPNAKYAVQSRWWLRSLSEERISSNTHHVNEQLRFLVNEDFSRDYSSSPPVEALDRS